MTLLNQDVPEAVARQNPIIQSLDRALTRGDKLFTGQPKENLDMMFTKLLIQEDLPLNLGESAHFQDFMLEVSKGSYKGASRQTVRALLSLLSDLGRKEARLFARRPGSFFLNKHPKLNLKGSKRKSTITHYTYARLYM